jgi:hypothetical protein
MAEAQEINYRHPRWLNPNGPASYTSYGVRVAPNPHNGAQAAAFAAAPIGVAVGGAGGGRPYRAASGAGIEQRRQAAVIHEAVGQLLRADRHQQKSGH